MALFNLLYADGKTVECADVKKVVYIDGSTRRSVTVEADFEKHPYPVGTTAFWLYAEGRVICASGADLRAIEVRRS